MLRNIKQQLYCWTGKGIGKGTRRYWRPFLHVLGGDLEGEELKMFGDYI